MSFIVLLMVVVTVMILVRSIKIVPPSHTNNTPDAGKKRDDLKVQSVSSAMKSGFSDAPVASMDVSVEPAVAATINREMLDKAEDIKAPKPASSRQLTRSNDFRPTVTTTGNSAANRAMKNVQGYNIFNSSSSYSMTKSPRGVEKSMCDDRENDWMTNQLREEHRDYNKVSEMFGLKIEHSHSCDAEMLRRFYGSGRDMSVIDSGESKR
jgi:hypothetical protein